MPTIGHRRVYPESDVASGACAGSAVPVASPRPEILIPFPGQQRLLLRVAVLAGGNDVALHGASAANQRHEMIHRERARAHRSLAVVTEARRDPALPPRARPERAGAVLLAAKLGLGDLGHETRRGRHDSSLTV